MLTAFQRTQQIQSRRQQAREDRERRKRVRPLGRRLVRVAESLGPVDMRSRLHPDCYKRSVPRITAQEIRVVRTRRMLPALAASALSVVGLRK